MSITILDPVLGGKIRAVITILFTILIFAVEQFDAVDTGWVILVTKIYAIIVFAIQALTHLTPIGDVEPPTSPKPPPFAH